jgi:Family of unknown function (DUF6256)
VSSQLIRQDVLPISIGYGLLMLVLAIGLWLQRRSPADQADSRRPDAARHGWLVFARRVGGTALGGYLLLMAIVILYYYGVARVGGQFLTSAFTGCALLLAISLPLFAAASWWTQRRRRRADQRHGKAGSPGSEA